MAVYDVVPLTLSLRDSLLGVLSGALVSPAQDSTYGPTPPTTDPLTGLSPHLQKMGAAGYSRRDTSAIHFTRSLIYPARSSSWHSSRRHLYISIILSVPRHVNCLVSHFLPSPTSPLPWTTSLQDIEVVPSVLRRGRRTAFIPSVLARTLWRRSAHRSVSA